MPLKEGEKYFHISEIFSFYAGGTQMYLPEQSKMPDGEYRAIMLGSEAANAVAEHVAGVKIWQGYGYRGANVWQLAEIFNAVAQGIEEQLPWIKKEVKSPQFAYPVYVPPAELERRRDALRKMAHEKLGGEWFVLKRMPAIERKTTLPPDWM